MIRAPEVAMMIKLGSNIDIAEYGLSLTDIVPYIRCTTTDIASSDDVIFSISRISDCVSFRSREVCFNKGDIIDSEATG